MTAKAPITAKPNLTIGDRFRVKAHGHGPFTYTLKEIDENASANEFGFKCENQFGDTQYFSQTNFDFHGKNVVLIPPGTEPLESEFRRF